MLQCRKQWEQCNRVVICILARSTWVPRWVILLEMWVGLMLGVLDLIDRDVLMLFSRSTISCIRVCFTFWCTRCSRYSRFHSESVACCIDCMLVWAAQSAFLVDAPPCVFLLRVIQLNRAGISKSRTGSIASGIWRTTLKTTKWCDWERDIKYCCQARIVYYSNTTERRLRNWMSSISLDWIVEELVTSSCLEGI